MCCNRGQKPRMAALQLGETMHYRLDHLIPLCHLLDIPLIVDSSQVFALAQKYYPPMQLIQITSVEYVSYLSQFDLFFVSDKYMASFLKASCKLLFKKEIHFFYCPHGNSDKGFIDAEMNQETFHKLLLVYGEQMHRRIYTKNLISNLNALVVMGNIRKRFYKKYQKFFDSRIKNTILWNSKVVKHVFLYAPSWRDREGSTSFFTICKPLIEHLSPTDYLIIKFHPLLLTNDLGFVTHIYENYKDRKNIQFITENPLIYPLLQYVHVYLGDISSVGYDFLFFNRPMYFFDTRINPPLESKQLFECGIEVPPQHFKNPYPFILSTLSENKAKAMIREKTYHFVFAEDPPEEQLKQNIVNSYYSFKGASDTAGST